MSILSDAPSAHSRRLALIALLLISPAPSLGALLAFHLAPGTTLGGAAYAIGKIWLYTLPVAWLLVVERGRVSFSPMRPGEEARGLRTGAALGLVIAAVLFATHVLVIEQRLDSSLLRRAMLENGLDEPWRYIAACAWLATVNAMLEEYAFRWFIFEKCARLLPRAGAIALAVAIFTAHHVIVLRAFFDWPLALLASAGVLTGGAAWSWCYGRFGSIWPGYLSHAIVDLAIFVIGWRILFQ